MGKERNIGAKSGDRQANPEAGHMTMAFIVQLLRAVKVRRAQENQADSQSVAVSEQNTNPISVPELQYEEPRQAKLAVLE